MNNLNSTQKSSSSSSSSSFEIALPSFDDIVEEVKYPPINVNIPGKDPVKVEYNKLQEILKANNMPEYSFVDILKNMSKRQTTKHINEIHKANIRRKVANMIQKIGETLIDGFIASILKKFKKDFISDKYSDMEIKDIVSKLNEECKFL
jgi:hypothetical protein